MATLSIKQSQFVADTNESILSMLSGDGSGDESLSKLLDGILELEYAIANTYTSFFAWNFSNSTLRLNYLDGAIEYYFGVNLSAPNASSGVATATSHLFEKAGLLRISDSGWTTLDYSVEGPDDDYLSFSTEERQIATYSLTTLLSANNPSYDPEFGNFSILLNGHIKNNSSNNLSGYISSISITPDKYISNSTYEGSFQISGNVTSIGQGLASSVVTGQLTRFSETYKDGSYIQFDGEGTGIYLADNQNLDFSIFTIGQNFPDNDNFNIDLPAQIYNDVVIASGAGDDTLILKGGGGRLSANAGAGNDTISLGDRGHVVDGGDGLDRIVYSTPLDGFTIKKTSQTVSVNDVTGSDLLSNMEHLQFSDVTINLTIQAAAASIAAAQVTRLEELYVAFFNRIPDADGMEYWINQHKSGLSINQIAEAFYNAGVFYADLTGFSSSMSNADFVNVVYRNVLGRSEGADADGLAFWSGALARGEATHGSLVSAILDSAHTFKGNATWGWVADLLDNKIEVAKQVAVDWGLNYNTPEDSISNGMAIAAAVTPSDISEAISLVGITPEHLSLV